MATKPSVHDQLEEICDRLDKVPRGKQRAAYLEELKQVDPEEQPRLFQLMRDRSTLYVYARPPYQPAEYNVIGGVYHQEQRRPKRDPESARRLEEHAESYRLREEAQADWENAFVRLENEKQKHRSRNSSRAFEGEPPTSKPESLRQAEDAEREARERYNEALEFERVSRPNGPRPRDREGWLARLKKIMATGG